MEPSERVGALGTPTDVGPHSVDVEARLIHELVRERLFGARGDDGRAPVGVRVAHLVVLRKLGQGGMGVVYLAYDERLDRKVAVKLLHPRPQASAEHRIMREARALARLSHPNVVQVHEIGVHEGATFVAMEFVEGVSLREWSSVPRRWTELLEVATQCGRGLEAAHRAGLVHRDFKPENVMVASDGRPRVLDFGLVRDDPDQFVSTHDPAAPAAAEAAITRRGALIGTPAYMAPEQLEGQRCTAATDQFALCVTIYEAIYGVRPFLGDDVDALREAMASGPPSFPSEPRLPLRVRRALARGLARRPDERWPEIGALLDELERPVRRGRRPWALATLAAGLLALGFGWRSGSSATPTCALDSTMLEGTWDASRRAELRAGVTASRLAYTETTSATVEAALERWASDWLDTQIEICEATHVRGVQSPALLDARRACLERQRRDVGVFVELWTQAGDTILEATPELLDELPVPRDCARSKGDAARDLSPAELRPEVESARDQLQRARLRTRTGELDQAGRDLAALARESARFGAPRLTLELRAAEAELALARDQYDRGAEIMAGVIAEARLLGLDTLEASARTTLARELASDWSKPAAEAIVLAEARTALRRLEHRPARLEVALQQAAGYLQAQAGDYDAALDSFQRARELRAREAPLDAELHRADIGAIHRLRGDLESARQEYTASLAAARGAFGERSPFAAAHALELGALASDMGELDDAEALVREALEIQSQVRGPSSLPAAKARRVLAKIHAQRGALDAAQTELEAAIAVFEAELGPEAELSGECQNALGALRFYAGDLPGSIAAYERARSVYARIYGQDHHEYGLVLANLGESLAAAGHPEDALRSYARAQASFERALAPDHIYQAVPAKGRAHLLLAAGRAEDALPEYERALAIFAKYGDEPHELADTRHGLARCLDALGRDPARALELASQARAAFSELDDERTAEVDAWLAERSP